jgi:hypothetical protein
MKMVGTLALVVLIAVPAAAQEQKNGKKKSDDVKRSMVTRILEMLEPVSLTAAQEAKNR